jgi:hypothetical protein
MFKRKERYILRDNVRRSLIIKYKYINLIQKSLLHNRKVKHNKHIIIFYKYSYKKKGYKKVKNICLLSGENTGVNKKLLLTRFQINYLSILNKLQNLKVSS